MRKERRGEERGREGAGWSLETRTFPIGRSA
jgi:hypothetical protein